MLSHSIVVVVAVVVVVFSAVGIAAAACVVVMLSSVPSTDFVTPAAVVVIVEALAWLPTAASAVSFAMVTTCSRVCHIEQTAHLKKYQQAQKNVNGPWECYAMSTVGHPFDTRLCRIKLLSPALAQPNVRTSAIVCT